MKVFISQPMDNIGEMQIRQNVFDAEKWLEQYFGSDVIAVNGYIDNVPPAKLHDGQIGLWYIGQSIQKLAECDAIVMLKGWHNSRGCLMEYQVAQAYGLPVIIKEMPNA